MDLIKEGLKEKLICLEDGGKYIVYLTQNKRRTTKILRKKYKPRLFFGSCSSISIPPTEFAISFRFRWAQKPKRPTSLSRVTML